MALAALLTGIRRMNRIPFLELIAVQNHFKLTFLRIFRARQDGEPTEARKIFGYFLSNFGGDRQICGEFERKSSCHCKSEKVISKSEG